MSASSIAHAATKFSMRSRSTASLHTDDADDDDDGVVVEARHLTFVHKHPVFDGKPVEEWDETHKRQNAPERYAEGEAIFRRRNAHLLK